MSKRSHYHRDSNDSDDSDDYKIYPFYGRNSVFSQFYSSEFTEDGIKFKTSEQYMHYRKAKLFKDDKTAAEILTKDDPKECKLLGRKVKEFNEIDWSLKKVSIVKDATHLKYSQNKELMEKLLSTYPKLMVEASPYDRVWGVGISANNKDIYDTSKWRGINLLGKILTYYRDMVLSERKFKQFNG